MSKLPKGIDNITRPVYELLIKKYNSLDEEKVSAITVSDIKSISSDELSSLRCGDIVCKEDSSGKHSYVVTYKKDNVGICLSYFDGSGYIETVSYDYTGGTWVYNSTDVFEGSKILPKTETASVGQILGLDSDKKPQWQNAPSGGTKLYRHTITIVPSSGTPYTMATFDIISTSNSVVSQLSGVVNLINSGNTMVSRVSGSLVDSKTFLVASATAPSPKGHLYYIAPTGVIDNETIIDATTYKVGIDTVTEL